jgi:hypothetical protein
MKPNVSETRDPLNEEALPPTHGMELDYRIQVLSPEEASGFTWTKMLLWAIVAMPLALLFHISARFISTPLFLSMTLLVGFLMDMHSWKRLGRRPASIVLDEKEYTLRYFFHWSAVGPIAWAAAVTFMHGPTLLVFFLPIALVLFASHRITHHFSRWMHANPFLSRDTRVQWLKIWRTTSVFDELKALVVPRHTGTGSADKWNLDRNERARYPLAFAAIIGAYLLALFAYFITPGHLSNRTVALSVFVIVLIGFGYHNAAAYSKSVSLRDIARIIWQGLASYFTYNPNETSAPGVFQSPWGYAYERRFWVRTAFLIIPVLVLPSAAYFPIVPMLVGDEVWLEAASIPYPGEEQAQPAIPMEGFFAGEVAQILPVKPSPELLATVSEAERQEYIRAFTAEHKREKKRRLAYARLYHNQETFLFYTLVAVRNLEPIAMFSIVISIMVCVCVTPILFATVHFALSSRVQLHYFLTLEGNKQHPARYHYEDKPSEWQALAHRLRESQHLDKDARGREFRESDHLLAGVSVEGTYPVLVSKDVIAEHVHILGDSGSGKTARGLAPMLHQLIGRPNTSVIVFDLKATDLALFQEARHSVHAFNHGRPGKQHMPFKWFTNKRDVSTHVFNPFLQPHLSTDSMEPHTKAELMIQALGLDYGEGYGQYFFSSANRHLMQKIIQNNPSIGSFRELKKTMSDLKYLAKEYGLSKRDVEDASHLRTVIESLSTCDALNLTLEDGHPEAIASAIDFSAVVTTRQVLYFHLPAVIGQSTVRDIAKLALYSLLAAAERRGPSNHTVYVMIDEFQQIVSNDLHILFRMARSSGLPLIVANQTMSDLFTKATNLIPTVEGNTRMRQIFSCSDSEHRRSLIQACDEAMFYRESQSLKLPHSKSGPGVHPDGSPTVTNYGAERTITTAEDIRPRLNQNDLIEASDDPESCLLQITRGQDFTQFGGKYFIMQTEFHISAEEYERRRQAKWPSGPGTIVAPLPKNTKPQPQQKQTTIAAAITKPDDGPSIEDRIIAFE